MASVGLCFAFALLAETAGYSVALGAFLAGSLVAESGRHTPGRAPDLAAARPRSRRSSSSRSGRSSIRWRLPRTGARSLLVRRRGRARQGAERHARLVPLGLRSLDLAQGRHEHDADRRVLLHPRWRSASTTGAIDPALYGIAVGVSVVTTFLTPWLVRASEPLALVDRAPPAEAPAHLRVAVRLVDRGAARAPAPRSAALQAPASRRLARARRPVLRRRRDRHVALPRAPGDAARAREPGRRSHAGSARSSCAGRGSWRCPS